MRVAIFSETFLPKWDGVANTVCHLLQHLSDQGHETLMYAPQGAPSSYANTPIIELPSYPLPWYRDLRLVPPRKGMATEIFDFAPDIVHVVNPALLGLIGMRRAHKLGVPVLASYHTDLPGYTDKYGLGLFNEPLWSYFRWVHNQADLNVCPSEFTRQELLEHGFERVEIWGRGVDTEQYSPAHRHRSWRAHLSGGHPEAPLLVYVGRLAIEKRVDVIRPVLDAFPDHRLAIVGDGPLRGELEDLFAGTNTTFTGFLQGRDLARAYAAGDVFVFPGEHETFGNVGAGSDGLGPAGGRRPHRRPRGPRLRRPQRLSLPPRRQRGADHLSALDPD